MKMVHMTHDPSSDIHLNAGEGIVIAGSIIGRDDSTSIVCPINSAARHSPFHHIHPRASQALVNERTQAAARRDFIFEATEDLPNNPYFRSSRRRFDRFRGNRPANRQRKGSCVMPKRAFMVGFSLILISLMCATGAVWAAANDGLNLVPQISWDKEAVFPSADVAVEVKYTNVGAAPIPDDAQVKFHLELWEIVSGENPEPKVLLKTGDVEVPEARGKGTGQSFSASAKITAPAEGNYNLVAILAVNHEAPVEQTELFAVKSALPPGLARLFAGLGMFVAVMAIMAAGTEVVIDSVKFLLGMKQKITALDALDQLKDQLPGQLAELGVNQKSQERITKLFGELDITLQPLKTAGDVYTAIKNGQFSTAFGKIKELETTVTNLQGQLIGAQPEVKKTIEDQIKAKLEEMQPAAQTGAKQVLTQLGATFKLSPATVAQIEATTNEQINRITVDSSLAAADYAAKLVGGLCLEIQQKGPEWTANWLKTQADLYLMEGRSKVVDLLDLEIIPVLTDLGLSDANVKAVRGGAVKQIDGFQGLLQEKAATYTLAVKELLTAVEEKRNDMQSPARKVWRWLRDSKQVSFGGTLIAAVLGIVIVVAAGGLYLPPAWPASGIRLGIAFLGVLIFGFLTWLMRRWAPSLGEALTWIEKHVNLALGRKENPNGLGEVEADIQKVIDHIGPTSVAAVLLKLEDKHQDEEASRIRLLRIISILVGVILAYILQIDALVLLQEALPGAVKVNITLATTQQLKQWPELIRPVLNFDVTAGILLTGLAASAGSKFWRDLLGRLQATKEQAESAAVLLRKTKATLGLKEE
jgi:hypothetical protein